MRFSLPAKFFHQPDGRYIEVLWTGLVTDEELVSEIKNYIHDGLYTPGTHELVDLSQADLSGISVDGMGKIADIFSRIQGAANSEGKKVAIFAPNNAAFALAATYSLICDEKAQNVQVFSERSEAESWLKST